MHSPTMSKTYLMIRITGKCSLGHRFLGLHQTSKVRISERVVPRNCWKCPNALSID